MDGHFKSREELLVRLKRIEGQIRGIQRMVSEETYCNAILTQITAASHALKRVAVGLLEDNMARCVDQGVAAGGSGAEKMVPEASAAIERLVRSSGRSGPDRSPQRPAGWHDLRWCAT